MILAVMFAAALAIAIGGVVIYWVWPQLIAGQAIWELMTIPQLHGAYTNLIGWGAVGGMGATAASWLVWPFESSRAAILWGSLVSFGVAMSHVWWIALTIGTVLFDVTNAHSSPVSPLWLLVVTGWLCVVVGVVAVIRQRGVPEPAATDDAE